MQIFEQILCKDEEKTGEINKYLLPFFIRKIYIKKRYNCTFTGMA